MSNQQILIVNDHNDIANLFADGLQMNGFKTTTFNDSLSAIEEVKNNQNQFSLVLIDRTSQQDMNFPNLIKRINNQIKVVLTSAFAFNDAEISSSEYDKIVQLPVTMSKLVSTVKEVLQPPMYSPA